jgi:hypothetical protein
MSGNLRQTAKWSMPVIIPALLAGMVVGGWRIWEYAAAGDTTPPVQKVEPRAVEQPRAPTIEISVAKSFTEPAAIDVTTPNEPGDDKTAKPTGKKHEREENLLMIMAMHLHSEAYDRFIRQKGFGMSRMVPMMTVVKRDWKKPDWTSEELAKGQGDIKGAKDLSLLHMTNVNIFLDSNTKTDKERNAVFSTVGASKKEYLWEIKSLDLVGLIMHETPTVYISEKLPNMKDLANRPTREMDVFEMEGLEELMAGKDMYIRAKDDTIRVLGPVRASKACTKCHSDAKDGDMLGAFSYTLRLGQYQMNGRGISSGPHAPLPQGVPPGLLPQGGQQVLP